MLKENEDLLELSEVDGFIECEEEKIIYPCVVLLHADTVEEREYFSNRKFNSNLALALYFKCEDTLIRAGSIDLILESFLALKNIYPYKVSIYRSEKDKIDIDIEDPNKLLQFIKI